MKSNTARIFTVVVGMWLVSNNPTYAVSVNETEGSLAPITYGLARLSSRNVVSNLYSYPAGCLVTYPEETTFTYPSYWTTGWIRYETPTTVHFEKDDIRVTFSIATTLCVAEGEVKVPGGKMMTFPAKTTMTFSADTTLKYQGLTGPMVVRHAWNGAVKGKGQVEWVDGISITVTTPGTGENKGCMV